jgi:hypothetical protein
MWPPAARLDARWTPAKHDWFSGQQWMIARMDPSQPDALVLAAKGGHNGEPHNQNDVGSFIVHVRGSSVVADPGRGRYTRFYFGPERYQHFVNSSLGHSVPVPNARVQQPGREHAAQLLGHTADDQQDGLSLELAAAYPAEAELASLRRSVRLLREPPAGRVEVIDQARFAAAPGSFESVLITFGEVELDTARSAVLLRDGRAALKVTFDAQAVTPRVELIEAVDLADGPTDVRRVVFGTGAPALESTVRLLIEPLP